MDIFDEEILKFWAALQKEGVRYIMVGGYAANLHGYQRYTGDVDDGIKVPFLHINQLIENKRAVNRPKDQIDVIELERIRHLMDEN
ncbi:MAG TPA: hypothetical protein VN616_05095 [Puia sp.]|nr:hypothetical protein [Puia sp.]